MRRVLVRSAGGYEKLEIVEAPEPVPRDDEVLVDVDAIGVNFADCVVRMGLYASAQDYIGWPITPGFEVAGRTVDGARVVALTRFGGYATRLAVPKRQVFSAPEGFTVQESAAYAVASLTAYYALYELAKLREGMNVLVHSAAGGVGSSLVVLARLAGCRVVGVVSGAQKVEHVRALGADLVIDKRREPLWPRARSFAPKGYDVVLDANGVETLRQSYRHLSPTGRLVIYGFHSMLPKGRGRPSWLKLARDWLATPRFHPLAMTNDNKSVMAFNLSYLFERDDLLREAMTTIGGLFAEKKIPPPHVTTYPFERVADAHRALETGTTFGKLVLVT